MVSRRSLLHHGIVAAIACLAKPLTAWCAKKNPQSGNSNQNKITDSGWPHLHRASFTRAVGSSFQVTPPSGTPVWLRLLAVEDLPVLSPPNLGAMAVQPPKTTPITTTGFMLSFLGTMVI